MLLDRAAQIVRLKGFDRLGRRAALARDIEAQCLKIRAALPRQSRGPLHRRQGQRLGLVGRQPLVLQSLRERFHEKEHVGRPRPRSGRHQVQSLFGLHPLGGAHALHDTLGALTVERRGSGRSVQARAALLHHRGRVGHGAHDPIGFKPPGNRGGGHRRGNRQDGGCRIDECGRLQARVLEALRFDRKHHDVQVAYPLAERLAGIDAEAAVQRRELFRVAIHHRDMVRARAGRHQAACDGAGHVAAAEKSDFEHVLCPFQMSRPAAVIGSL